MVVTKQRVKGKGSANPPVVGEDEDSDLRADMRAVAKRCLLAVVTNDLDTARAYEARFMVLHQRWQARGHPATSLITEAKRPDRLYLA